MARPKYEVVETSSVRCEDGAKELLGSPEMEPYARYIEALVLGHDLDPAIQEIAKLPLEKRYVWRVASAMKWGFADFDDVNVEADLKTLSQNDAARLVKLLTFRPIQFCMFLKALLGAEAMERIMMEGIATAKEQ